MYLHIVFIRVQTIDREIKMHFYLRGKQQGGGMFRCYTEEEKN